MNIERPELASLPTPVPPEGLVLVINAGSSSPMAALSRAAGTSLWRDQRPGNGAAGALAAFLALGRGRWPVVLNQGYRFASAKQDGVSEVR